MNTEPELSTTPEDVSMAELLAEESADEFLASLISDTTANSNPELTPEQIEAQAARVEEAKTYDVAAMRFTLHSDITLVKASIGKLLVDTTHHLNAEYNKAIVSNDMETANSLVSTEGPRWYQLAVADFQTALMKLERAINHPEGL
jgi:hypothetical protein